MTARRDWRVTCDGLTLSMEVTVNGSTLRADSRLSTEYATGYSTAPPQVIERQLRRQIMAALETELLGPLE